MYFEEIVFELEVTVRLFEGDHKPMLLHLANLFKYFHSFLG